MVHVFLHIKLPHLRDRVNPVAKNKNISYFAHGSCRSGTQGTEGMACLYSVRAGLGGRTCWREVLGSWEPWEGISWRRYSCAWAGLTHGLGWGRLLPGAPTHALSMRLGLPHSVTTGF